jgi:hypothetical protein
MVELTAEARARLDAHLDAVERSLVGRSRSERRGIVDDLEAQVLEMAARRADGETVGVKAVEGVLAEMDPVEAYGAGGEAAAPAAVQGRGEREGRIEEKAFKRKSAMKSVVAIAVIVCGTFLIVAPQVFAYLQGQQMLEVMKLPNGVPSGANVNWAPMPEGARMWRGLIGAAAIFCGVVGAFVAFATERGRRA